MADNIHAPHSSGLAPMAVFVCVHFLLASPASIAYHLTMVSHFNIGDYWGGLMFVSSEASDIIILTAAFNTVSLVYTRTR